MIFHWSLSDWKSPQLSRTFLSIQGDLYNAVVWMVSARPLISKYSSPLTRPLGFIRNTPITTGINVTFTLHSFFSSLARPRFIFLFSFSLIFTQWSAGTAKSTIRELFFFFFFSFFLLTVIRSGLLGGIKRSVCISQSQRISPEIHFLNFFFHLRLFDVVSFP